MLKQEVIQEIIKLGASNSELTDPSLSTLLQDIGVATVTAYLEKLSLFGIVKDASPIFGQNGGMWIGYTLTDRGINCSEDKKQFDALISEINGKPINEISQSVLELVELCKNKDINIDYKETFVKTLEEIAICFQNNCYIATITLCGKILEICLIDLLKNHQIDVGVNQTLGSLLKKINENIPDKYLDPTLGSTASIISKSRNTAVHYNERIPIPSRDQALMVIFATRDVVNRYLTW